MRYLPVLLAVTAFALACSNNDGANGSATTTVSAPPRSPGPLPSLEERITFYGTDSGDGLASIAVGDFNGDGLQDVALGAALADGPENDRPETGEVYLFMGPFTAGESVAAMSDSDVVIYGASAGDQLGRALTAGDFNDDGVDDIAMGAPFSDGADGSRPDAGKTYVLMGSPLFGSEPPAVVDLGRRDVDLVIEGADAQDIAGIALAAGDVNGDGPADIIVGAPRADGPLNERQNAGEVYVIYGGDGIASVQLSSGGQDVTVFGANDDDRLGETVGAGDVNGDGIADVLAVATFADGPDDQREAAGETYVILGAPPAVVDIAGGEQSATIVGVDAGDQLGHSIAVGDVNGDGLGDIILGAVSADGPGNAQNVAGEIAVVVSLPEMDLVDIAADGAAAVVYGDAGDRLGRSLASGDFNGDGYDDIVAAAPKAPGPAGDVPAGSAYVFLGSAEGEYPFRAVDADITLRSLDPGDDLGHQGFGVPALKAADIDGDGLADILVSAPSADGEDGGREGAGEVYLLYARVD